MSRQFTAQDLIQLPALGAEDAIALITQLATTAKAEAKLSTAIAESLAELETANELLMAEVRKRGQGDGRDPAAARAADAAVDRAWSAFESWLSGWAASEGHPHEAEARAAHARLFPDGLLFLTKKYKVEWTESQTRLDIVQHEKLDKLFDALGGKHFLKSLRAAHTAYGQALGITEVSAAPAKAPAVRPALDDALGAAREYVAQVAGSVRRKKPDTEALATRLLAPLSTWESSRRAAPQAGATPPAAAGSPTPSAPATPAS